MLNNFLDSLLLMIHFHNNILNKMNYKLLHIKHVFDFRITKHINTNHDNILSFDF